MILQVGRDEGQECIHSSQFCIPVKKGMPPKKLRQTRLAHRQKSLNFAVIRAHFLGTVVSHSKKNHLIFHHIVDGSEIFVVYPIIDKIYISVVVGTGISIFRFLPSTGRQEKSTPSSPGQASLAFVAT